MTTRPMTSDEQIVYKNMIDNLSFMKRQQWVITSYAVAIFIGLFGLTQGRSLSADAIQSLVFVVKLGCLLCWYFLIRVQIDIARQRRGLLAADNAHFDAAERGRLGLNYKFPFLRDIDFVIAFMAVSGASAWLVIYFWRHALAS